MDFGAPAQRSYLEESDPTMTLRTSTCILHTILVAMAVAVSAAAQCPGGTPPLPNGKCPAPRVSPSPSPTPARAVASCSILINIEKSDGGELANIDLTINGQRSAGWRTNPSGVFILRGLA